MDFWTFVTTIVIIIVSGDVIKNLFNSLHVYKANKINIKEIDNMKRRVNDVDSYSKQIIEKRLQAIESIVVDTEYDLKMKFKKLLEEK